LILQLISIIPNPSFHNSYFTRVTSRDVHRAVPLPRRTRGGSSLFFITVAARARQRQLPKKENLKTS
jgi:hypothetical protein